MGRSKLEMPERLWSKVDRTPDTDSCWPWVGKARPDGYANVYADGRLQLGHRIAFNLMAGRIPSGLTLDHLCRNRACVNPWHLEPVTLRENVLRGVGMGALCAKKTHCLRGHPFDEKNMRIDSRGKRICRACCNEWNRGYNARPEVKEHARAYRRAKRTPRS